MPGTVRECNRNCRTLLLIILWGIVGEGKGNVNWEDVLGVAEVGCSDDDAGRVCSLDGKGQIGCCLGPDSC